MLRLIFLKIILYIMINDLLEVETLGSKKKCEPVVKQDDERAKKLAAD